MDFTEKNLLNLLHLKPAGKMIILTSNFFRAKKIIFLPFIMLLIGYTHSYAQEKPDTAIEHLVVYRTVVYKPFPVSGRVIGVNLESVKGGQVINICSADTGRTDDNGFFHLSAAAGDTLAFVSPKYSATVVGVRSQKDKFNVILIKRKTASLPPGYAESDYNKAAREDNNLLKILDKDAKAEGKWNY